MPAYLVIHPRDQRRDDLRLSGDCLAIPSGQGASIQRDDEPLPDPALEKR